MKSSFCIDLQRFMLIPTKFPLSLNFPDRFKKKGRLAYYTLTHKTGAIVLVGFYLDNSIDPNSFFVNYFAQCLYVPFCTYNFSLGDRIGSYWQNVEC